jgi:Kef-type K+ transport system membrane component KefB
MKLTDEDHSSMIETCSPMKTDHAGMGTRTARLTGVYGLTVLATIALFFVIRDFGESLTVPATVRPIPVPVPVTPAAKMDVLMHVLLALLGIIVTCRIMGWMFRRLGQPPVIGEILAGIILGPSLLGRVAPGLAVQLLPAEIAPYLAVIAQLGVILYMFMVGLEVDTTSLAHRGRAAVAISHASIVVPFILGAGLALALYPRLSSGSVPFTVFALFLGVAMSVTAFPVLARILTDRGMNRSPLGVMALTCAAVDDVTAWCLLALVVGVAKAQIAGAASVVLGATGYITFMFLVVRPLSMRLARFDQHEDLSSGTIALVLAGLLLSASITEFIGIHAVFGAFVLGAAIPSDSVVARQVIRRLQDVVSVLFLPAFFVYTGMRTRIGLVSSVEEWLLCGVIIGVATLGKFGGTLGAARLAGIGGRDAAALGILMNTRGLMELIVLNVGLDLGVISPKLFAMMVFMAVVTTLATAPILRIAVPPITHVTGDGLVDRVPDRDVGRAGRQPTGAIPSS